MVFLVGTHHERQHNGHGSKKMNNNQDFVEYIKENINKQNITIIAEEFSEEALGKSGATESTLKCIAKYLGIEHCFCDPNSKERDEIGILSDEKLKLKLKLPRALNHEDLKKFEEEKKKYYHIREEFWLKKIQGLASANMIFVCGIKHLDSFQSLLSQNSIKAFVLDKKF